jgi:hypothetical protein
MVSPDNSQAARHPLAFSGEERAETREHTETIGRTFQERVQELAARIQALAYAQQQDRSEGMSV